MENHLCTFDRVVYYQFISPFTSEINFLILPILYFASLFNDVHIWKDLWCTSSICEHEIFM